MRLGLPILTAALAVVLYPQIRPSESLDLDKIEDWGLKGPGRDLPLPFMGVYLFKGLNPFLTVDLSHAYDWDPEEKSFMFDFSRPGSVYAEHGLDSGYWAPTSKSPGVGPEGLGFSVRGWIVARVCALIRLRVKFIFTDDSLTVAEVPPSLFGIPASVMGPLVFKSLVQVIRRGENGVWYRDNLDPVTQERLHGYELLPLLTLDPMPSEKAGGDPVLDHGNLRLAKQKLNGSPAFQWAEPHPTSLQALGEEQAAVAASKARELVGATFEAAPDAEQVKAYAADAAAAAKSAAQAAFEATPSAEQVKAYAAAAYEATPTAEQVKAYAADAYERTPSTEQVKAYAADAADTAKSAVQTAYESAPAFAAKAKESVKSLVYD